MKIQKRTVAIYLIAVLLVLLFSGCSTLQQVEYSFSAPLEDVAALYLVGGNPGVTLLYYEDKALPEAEKGTYWNPIKVLAGQPFALRVHVYYSQDSNTSAGLLVALATAAIASSRTVDSDLVFDCPALEANKEYVLEFKKGIGLKGSNALLLTDKATKDIIYQQDF